MSVLVGFAFGVIAGWRGWQWRFATLLALPLAVAAFEIVVNAIRFGAGTVVVWALILVALTTTATAVGSWLGRKRQRRAVGT